MQALSKKKLVGEVIARYRAATNRDVAFDKLAAARLGVSVTDLHCLNIVESRRGLTAGDLARESGLTTGAVTAVIDRLERAGFARRVPDEHDRRKVKVEVTEAFYADARDIWGPVAADWEVAMASRFSAAELATVVAFLTQVEELGERHAARLAPGDVP
ncbi:MAG TPA: MarR family transcriptional regulator [Solirubrobacteraceae bacterium]|nr:MarR family transcriptional regulator [Solirubrobacteraceae bacterium]